MSEKITETMLDISQLEAVNEVTQFIQTLSSEEVKEFRVFLQGAKLTSNIIRGGTQ
uniref:hypothetical protein n=1 Tax=Acetatifactor sp. TaxID=1872090 RepID=UPI0040566521